MNWKKLFLVGFKMLGLLVNTLTSSYSYFRSNRESLQLPIQMQLFEKLKLLFQFSTAFFESTLKEEN